MAQRPTSFHDFTGQPEASQRLQVAVRAARNLRKPLDHIMLLGGPGLGKSTLGAHVLPGELGTTAVSINCGSIQKTTDLLPTLTTMRAGQILFLDEIHALAGTGCFDYLLTVLEDRYVSVKLGEGPTAQVARVDLEPFTIIGATTREGRLPEPVRDRFFHQIRLSLYDRPQMIEVLRWTARQQDLEADDDSLGVLADSCHGTARWAVRLLSACRDTLAAHDVSHRTVTPAVAFTTLERLGFRGGLTEVEIRCLQALARQPRPVGLSTLASLLDEEQLTVEETIEPWLLYRGLIEKTPKGRAITGSGIGLLNTNGLNP